MSSYEAKDFKVGDPIDSEVAKHIELLQDVFGTKDGAKPGNSRQAYIELQGSIPWIKMQSGVKLSDAAAADYNTTSGDALAKANILFGLNVRLESKDDQGNPKFAGYAPNTNTILPGYEQSKDLGIRPRPGITSMNIQSHNRFGSLRTATVSYQCWTKEQMDAMEVLYMRPGMTVLLEWGHSKILKSETQVVPSDFGIDYFTAGDSIPKLISEIHSKRKQSKYSYDAIVGIIKNFSWSFRADGGYDCRVDLVTSGDLIESYKANFYLEQSVVEELVKQQVGKYKEDNNVTGSLNLEFPNVLYDSKTLYSLKDIPALDGLYGEFCGALESALASAPSYFESYINSVDDTEKKRIYDECSFKSEITNDLSKALDWAKKILGSLSLVKGGATLAKATQGYLVDNKLETVGTVEIKSQSPWTNGIVNLNVADLNNDLESGKVEAGYAAILPLRGDYPSVPDLLYATDQITKLDTFGPTQALAMALNLLKYARFSDGQTYKQIFWFPGYSNFKGPTPIKYKPANAASTDFIQEIRPGSEVADRNFYVGNDGVFGTSHFDNAYKVNFYNLESNLPATLSPSPNRGETSYRYSLRSYIPSLVLKDYEDKFAQDTEFPYNLGPAAFGKVKFTGFSLIRKTNADLTQTVATIDPETGEAGAAILDRNDDNLSKLHHHLRAAIENVYTSRYLKQPFIGKNFSTVFRYRPLHGDNSSVPAEIETLFGFEKSAKVRKENLEVYGGYENQLKAWNLILGGRFEVRDGSNHNTVYVKLGALLELINRHILQSETNYFYLFKTTYKDKNSTPLYRTLDDHLSVDPEICILPHTISKLKIPGHDPSYLIGKDAPIILNIELSINFLLDTLTKYIDSDGSVTLLTYLQEILDEVSRVCGGVNDLQLQYMEDAGLFYVVDRTAITPYPKSDYQKINVFGLNSIVRNVNMVSKITPKMSSMIAISAQDTAFTSTEESTGFAALNRGVTDRMYADRYDEDRKAKDNTVDYDELRTKLLNDVVDLKEQLRTYYEERTVPIVSTDTRAGVYENYCKFLLGADSKYRVGGRPTYNFIIPFELQLELYGISGIQVMDAFIINKDILPKTYGGRTNAPIAFLVTGVEHTINRGSWVTRLKTQIFNIEETLAVNPTAPAFGLVNGVKPNGFPPKTTSSSEAFKKNMPNYDPDARPSWAPIEKHTSVRASSLIAPWRSLKNRPHYGIDFAANKNLKCIAVCDGIWAAGGNNPDGYGDTWGYLKEYDSEGKHIRSHVYGHTNKTMFKTGDKVKKGDVVALVGNKGSSTGDHLHYEIWWPYKSKRYDATVYLNETTPPAGVNTF